MDRSSQEHGPLTRRELDHLFRMLVRREHGLRRALRARDGDSPDAWLRDLQPGPEPADLVETEAALVRFAVGSYGVCTSCASHIGYARLEARPHEPRCLACEALRVGE
jgi:hypothetical protein